MIALIISLYVIVPYIVLFVCNGSIVSRIVVSVIPSMLFSAVFIWAFVNGKLLESLTPVSVIKNMDATRRAIGKLRIISGVVGIGIAVYTLIPVAFDCADLFAGRIRNDRVCRIVSNDTSSWALQIIRTDEAANGGPYNLWYEVHPLQVGGKYLLEALPRSKIIVSFRQK